MHPNHLVDEDIWAVIRLAREWRSGKLPEAGGVGDQAACTVAAIEIVLATWARMEAELLKRKRKD